MSTLTAQRTAGRHSGADRRRLNIALLVICTAQLMVVLDETIVNTALPHIQRSLTFSGTGLEWVVNAYALTFGGLLLLGGRAGDILGRRTVFMFGLTLFSIASLLGGFATADWWLLTTRALQGVGAALAAPTALALIGTTFPEGPSRNRALGVYAGMTGAGGSIGLLAGGLLTTYLSWRWVFFVNVPIGILVAVAARYVLAETDRQRTRFDLPGALTATAGFSLLVYGLSRAATGSDGVSHWTDTATLSALAAAVLLLATFMIVEWRSASPLLSLRLFANRNRSAAYLIVMCFGTALFAMFFFLTLVMQTVWGYSAIRTGTAYLPLTIGLVVVAGISSQLINRIGGQLLMLLGAPLAVVALYWLSRINEHGHYTTDMLGPMVVMAIALGMLLVPLTTLVVSDVPARESGVAASLFNVGQQIGGSIGLAVVGTIAWSTVYTSIRSDVRRAVAAGGTPPAVGPGTTITDHALATGFARGLAIGAAAMLVAMIIAYIAVRIRRPKDSPASQVEEQLSSA